MLNPEDYTALKTVQNTLEQLVEQTRLVRARRDRLVMEAVAKRAFSTEIEAVTGLSRSGVDEIKRRARRTGRV